MGMAVALVVAAAMVSLLVQGNIAPPPPRLLVAMTIVPHAGSLGAVCLDGSPPGYHLHRGFGAGARNWLLQFEGGGWCNDVESCLERSRTRRGSTRYMNRLEVFSGILSNDSAANPDFYNWNRVKLRYCDGASFAGDSEYHTNKTTLYFRGQRIWEAIILDLLQKGLFFAQKALLSGCSAGGLATFLHCDDFAKLLPNTTIVKCMSDAGFFLDVRDITGNNTIEPFFRGVVTLQGVQKKLNETCLASEYYPYQCFFPQNALKYIRTPYFILNSAYDVYQFHHIFVPPSADPRGHWNHCKLNLAECTVNQIAILQDFRFDMLLALRSFENSTNGGMFINSCFTHCQSESQETWFAPNSLRLHNKTIAEAVGDWYFGRNVTREVDCPYPCGSTCHNLLPSNQVLNKLDLRHEQRHGGITTGSASPAALAPPIQLHRRHQHHQFGFTGGTSTGFTHPTSRTDPPSFARSARPDPSSFESPSSTRA